MNIRKLQFTDDLAKQIEIGKDIESTFDESMKVCVHRSLDRVTDYERIPIAREDLYYKSIYDYFAYGFLPEQQIYYHLIGKGHEEKSGYLTFKNKFVYFARLNKREDMDLLEDKFEAYKLLRKYYKREIIKLNEASDYDSFCDFLSRHETFVVKPLGLSCAMGVRKVDIREHADKRALFNSLINVGGAFKDDYSIRDSNFNGAVLEELIEQDPEYAKIFPDSVNGVRMTTIRLGEKVHFYHPWLKVGASKNIVASAALGGFDAGIDARTGIVDTDGFCENGERFQFHPITQVKIKGYAIPKWDELLALAETIALNMKPTINYVGWDFVLTPKGWVVMEGNFYGDTMWQMVYDKGMKEDFENLIGWKMEKKFWWQYNLKKLEQEW